MKKYKEAVECFDNALELKPDDNMTKKYKENSMKLINSK